MFPPSESRFTRISISLWTSAKWVLLSAHQFNKSSLPVCFLRFVASLILCASLHRKSSLMAVQVWRRQSHIIKCLDLSCDCRYISKFSKPLLLSCQAHHNALTFIFLLLIVSRLLNAFHHKHHGTYTSGRKCISIFKIPSPRTYLTAPAFTWNWIFHFLYRRLSHPGVVKDPRIISNTPIMRWDLIAIVLPIRDWSISITLSNCSASKGYHHVAGIPSYGFKVLPVFYIIFHVESLSRTFETPVIQVMIPGIFIDILKFILTLLLSIGQLFCALTDQS